MPVARSALRHAHRSTILYSTFFPAVENPISQGGIWLNGLADGGSWNNVQTTNTGDGVSRACGAAFVSGTDDPTAILKSSFVAVPADHYVAGVIYRAAGYTPTANYHETQLRGRFALSSGSATGYELLVALDNSGSSNDGWALVKWNGALGDYVAIANYPASISRPADGDSWRVEFRGSVAKVFLNGVKQQADVDLTAGGTLSVWSTGQPGVGMYPQTPGCTLTSFGWRYFETGTL